eukprot:6188263-Pleurochrysis_carterae.AAC.2
MRVPPARAERSTRAAASTAPTTPSQHAHAGAWGRALVIRVVDVRHARGFGIEGRNHALQRVARESHTLHAATAQDAPLHRRRQFMKQLWLKHTRLERLSPTAAACIVHPRSVFERPRLARERLVEPLEEGSGASLGGSAHEKARARIGRNPEQRGRHIRAVVVQNGMELFQILPWAKHT